MVRKLEDCHATITTSKEGVRNLPVVHQCCFLRPFKQSILFYQQVIASSPPLGSWFASSSPDSWHRFPALTNRQKHQKQLRRLIRFLRSTVPNKENMRLSTMILALFPTTALARLTTLSSEVVAQTDDVKPKHRVLSQQEIKERGLQFVDCGKGPQALNLCFSVPGFGLTGGGCEKGRASCYLLIDKDDEEDNKVVAINVSTQCTGDFVGLQLALSLANDGGFLAGLAIGDNDGEFDFDVNGNLLCVNAFFLGWTNNPGNGQAYKYKFQCQSTGGKDNGIFRNEYVVKKVPFNSVLDKDFCL
ncbi:hypothetical protein ACA910_007296 [Epithemia clementina (nom. ined.)]